MSSGAAMSGMTAAFIASQQSEQTRRAYQSDLAKWFLWLGDRTPDVELAVEFRNHLESHLAAASAARIFNTCRTYYRWMQSNSGSKHGNPFANIKSTKTTKNRTPDIPTDEEVAGIVRAAGEAGDAQGSLIIALCLNGLRSDEITRLKYEDFIFMPFYNNFVVRVLGKGNKERMVPANNYLNDAFQNYLNQFFRGSEYILEAPDGSPVTPRQVQYAVEKYSGFKRRPHSLRHHYATRLVRNGCSVFALQRLLGHESVETTQVYVNLDLKDLIFEAMKDPL